MPYLVIARAGTDVDAPERRPALDAWLSSDPYTLGDVWRDVMVLEVQTVFGGLAR
jgi:hypothetical protein